MRLVDAVCILGGHKGCFIPNMLGTIVASPVIDDIHIAGCSCGGADSCTRCSLNRFRHRRNSTHTLTVFSNSVVDGYFVLYPDGEHCVIRQVFIRGNLCDDCTSCAAQMIFAILCVVQIQVRSSQILRPVRVICFPSRGLRSSSFIIFAFACRNSRPAKECITCSSRSFMNVDSNVYYSIFIGYICSSSIILKPTDMGRSWCFGIDVNSL